MRALDLFAGCGGASIGLARAGLDVLADYERDPDACATLAAAGLHPVQCDLSTLDASTLPAVGLWWASPPCQPFSTAGKGAGMDDDRDGYPILLSLLAAASAPTWLVIENVRGLLATKHAAYWGAVQAALRAHYPWVDYRVLDAADYGVPQHRRRVITVCGPRPIVWPAPTHGEGRLPYVTMREALALGDARAIGGGRNPGWHGDVRRYSDLTDRPSTAINARPAGNAGPWVEGARPDWWHRASDPDGPSRTIGSRANASVTINPVDLPSPTVSATEEKGAGARATTEGYRQDGGKLNRASCALKVGTGRRRLTVEECLVLQDLAGHPVQGRTKASRYRQAGNAVPPRLAEVVALAVLASPRETINPRET